MKLVVAIGGNALLRRDQTLTAENQLENVKRAAVQLAHVAETHQMVLTHGNGPQVGLLALQGAAYAAVETYPLDVLDAQTEGMIGYMLEQELTNLLPVGRIVATLLYLTRSQIALFERVENARRVMNQNRIPWHSPPGQVCELSWSRPSILKLLL